MSSNNNGQTNIDYINNLKQQFTSVDDYVKHCEDKGRQAILTMLDEHYVKKGKKVTNIYANPDKYGHWDIQAVIDDYLVVFEVKTRNCSHKTYNDCLLDVKKVLNVLKYANTEMQYELSTRTLPTNENQITNTRKYSSDLKGVIGVFAAVYNDNYIRTWNLSTNVSKLNKRNHSGYEGSKGIYSSDVVYELPNNLSNIFKI